jgi:hypothetical protein
MQSIFMLLSFLTHFASHSIDVYFIYSVNGRTERKKEEDESDYCNY